MGLMISWIIIHLLKMIQTTDKFIGQTNWARRTSSGSCDQLLVCSDMETGHPSKK